MNRTFRNVLSWVLGIFVLLAGFTCFEILKVRGTFTPSLPASEAGGTLIQTGSPGHRIAGRVYLTGSANAASPLVIVLHGDAPGRNPSYQYIFASKVADAAPGTRVVALLRPGYADPFGARSDGDRGNFAAGENYTPAVVQDLAYAIEELKTRWHSPELILVGHSGGSTLTADIAALHPGLVQTAVLVSCPCDVPAFRRHMASWQHSPVWLLPVNALSPLGTLPRMTSATTIRAISGDQDPIALPQYTAEYIQAAKARGLTASMVSVPGQGHEILLLPQVVDLVVQEIHKAAPLSAYR